MAAKALRSRRRLCARFRDAPTTPSSYHCNNNHSRLVRRRLSTFSFTVVGDSIIRETLRTSPHNGDTPPPFARVAAYVFSESHVTATSMRSLMFAASYIAVCSKCVMRCAATSTSLSTFVLPNLLLPSLLSLFPSLLTAVPSFSAVDILEVFQTSAQLSTLPLHHQLTPLSPSQSRCQNGGLRAEKCTRVEHAAPCAAIRS